MKTNSHWLASPRKEAALILLPLFLPVIVVYLFSGYFDQHTEVTTLVACASADDRRQSRLLNSVSILLGALHVYQVQVIASHYSRRLLCCRSVPAFD
jgi:hypothetical protein